MFARAWSPRSAVEAVTKGPLYGIASSTFSGVAVLEQVGGLKHQRPDPPSSRTTGPAPATYNNNTARGL
jgi:hypothetical protein